MKKISLIFLSVFLVTPLWAGNKDDACYKRVRDLLQRTSQFQNLLPEAWTANVSVNISCENKGRAYGVLDPNVKKGDRVGSGSVNADIVLTVRDLVDGCSFRGTRETIHVEGFYGEYYQIEDSDFFEVSKINYTNDRLRE